jgi:hypothetical protein
MVLNRVLFLVVNTLEHKTFCLFLYELDLWENEIFTLFQSQMERTVRGIWGID